MGYEGFSALVSKFTLEDIFMLTIFVLMFLVFIISKVPMDQYYQPELVVTAKVVGKRMEISGRTVYGAGKTAETSYFVTFEVESGDRMEFHVTGTEYGLLIEGDDGALSFQGTRYKGFERRK